MKGGGGDRSGDTGRIRAEVEEELAFHIEGRAEELEAEGWPAAAAREEAARRFGDVTEIAMRCLDLGEERVRKERRIRTLEVVRQDAVHALRTLRRNPGFTLMAVLTLALGIGATTAIFSIVDGVVFRPLPFPSSEQLMMVYETNQARGLPTDPPSAPNFLDWRAAAPSSVTQMMAWRDESRTLTDVENPEVLAAVGTTANFFGLLGVRMALGRGFAAGEDESGGARVTVLSHARWQALFGGDSAILGRVVRLDGVPYEIIGVAPPHFAIPRPDVDLWIPTDLSNEHRQSRYLGVIARLRAGVTVAEANAELDVIAQRLEALYPEENGGWRTRLIPLRDQMIERVRHALLLVFGATVFVLLITCVNVANLLLGRARERAGELAIRTALGASAARLRIQLLVESVLLALLGGASGVVLAREGVRLFLSLEPRALPRAAEVAVDLRVLAFTIATTLLAGIGFGMTPGLRVGRAPLLEMLRAAGSRGAVSGRRADLTRRALIVSEVAFSLMLLVGAGLAVRSLWNLTTLDPGYATRDILTARIDIDEGRYPLAARVQYFERLLERIRQVPGVASAGITSTTPLNPAGIDFNLPYLAEGQAPVPEEKAAEVDYRIISPGYLEAMGIRLVSGRRFEASDRAGSRNVLLVNETFARLHWPGENAVGKRVKLFYVRNTEWEIVGVIGDTRHKGLAVPVQAQVFVPLAQAEHVFGYMTVVMRGFGDVAALAEPVRQAAVSLDPAEPLWGLATMETLVGRATLRDRLAALVFSLFAMLALLLSAAGIYGVISYQVTRRTREIGVRMALGASRARVTATVVGEAMGLAALGVVCGSAVALAGTRLARGMLFGVSTTDPATFLGVALLLLAVAMLAAIVPAVRAAAVHPIAALRQQ
jgi:putative ABC transport system permease protein